jgi:hypothetical protein
MVLSVGRFFGRTLEAVESPSCGSIVMIRAGLEESLKLQNIWSSFRAHQWPEAKESNFGFRPLLLNFQTKSRQIMEIFGNMLRFLLELQTTTGVSGNTVGTTPPTLYKNGGTP